MKDLDDIGEEILKFFFVVGIPNEVRKRKIETIKKDAKPTIISSFSSEGEETEEFKYLVGHIMEPDNYILRNIFPTKVDYLKKIDVNSENIQLDRPIFQDYIISNENKRPKHFFHCFGKEFYENPEAYYEWYFNCLIIYEDLVYSKNGEEENIAYGAKALIIVTHQPYFTLCNMILGEIYNNYYSKKAVIPLEVYIQKIFSEVRKELKKDIGEVVVGYTQRYFLKEEPQLDVYDLDLSFFLSYFSIEDFLFIAEHFLLSKNIVVVSEFPQFLYPFYHTLMTFVHPLTITNSSYTYQILTPESVYVNVQSDFPRILFLYGKNIPLEDIKKLIARKEFDTVYIYFGKKNEEFFSQKLFLKCLKTESEFMEFTQEEFPSKNFIKDITTDKYQYFMAILKGEFRAEKNLGQKKIERIFTQGNFNGDFNYNSARIKMFGLMMNFLIKIGTRVGFKIEDGKIIFIPILRVGENEDDENYTISYRNVQMSKDAVEKIGIFKTTPNFDIFYKNLITVSDKKIKYKILLDELIKIFINDGEKRLYFDLKIVERTPSYGKKTEEISRVDLSRYITDRDKQFYYMNKYQRYLCRNANNKVVKIYDEPAKASIEYQNFTLNFGLFPVENPLKVNTENNILMNEMEIFYILFITNTIPISNRKDYGTCAICLAICIYLVHQVNSKEVDIQEVSTLIETLISIFRSAKSNIGKFSFLFSFVYEIIISNQKIYKMYHKKFMDLIIELSKNKNGFSNIIPTISILLAYNNKKNHFGEKSDKIKKFKYSCVRVEEQNQRCESNKLKEHCHSFPIIEEGYANSDILCKYCGSPWEFIIDDNKGEHSEVLINPYLLIQRMLKQIFLKRTFIIPDFDNFYSEWMTDLSQVVILSKIYFKLDVFKS